MADIIEYKCPCCGGAISFDSKIQKLKCPYCDTEFNVDDLRSLDEALSESDGEKETKWAETPETEWSDSDGVRSYICNSCGGEIVCDENTSATSCPFCGNPVVLTERLGGTLKPD